MAKRGILILLGIILVGFILRFYQLGAIPQGFQVDEAAFGYNTYSLIKTGADEYGKKYPITFRSFDDYKAALYSYVDIPFVAVLGLSEAAVRLPSAIAGIFLILLSYAITLSLTKDRKLSLLTAFFIAISPTLIFQNRIQSEAVLSFTLFFAGLFFFLEWIKNKKISYFVLSLFLWAFSILAYTGTRSFLILFIPLLIIYLRKSFSKNWLGILTLGLIILFILNVFLIKEGNQRFNQVSVFNSYDQKITLFEETTNGGSSVPGWDRVIHNKGTVYGRAIAANYFSYFNFNFLFFNATYPVREAVENTGFLYLIDLPLLFIGIYEIIRKKVKWGFFLILWILITPASLALFSTESPNIHRFIPAILPLLLISAYGALEALELVKKQKKAYRVTLILIPLLLFLNLFYFLDELFIHQAGHFPKERNHAFKQLITDLSSLESNYKQIVLTTSQANTYIFYLFYNKYDPKKYQELGSPGNKNGIIFGKYSFIHEPCPLSGGWQGLDEVKGEKGILYVDSGDCVTPKYYIKMVEVINWHDNTPAFKLMEYDPTNIKRHVQNP